MADIDALDDDLDALMHKKREELIKQRDEAQAALDRALAQLRGIDGYYNAMSGKPVTTSIAHDGEKKPRKPRETGKRAEILALFQHFPDGATSAQLQDHLGIKGDKKSVQSLSNALSALKREGHLTQGEGRNAPYILASPA